MVKVRRLRVVSAFAAGASVAFLVSFMAGDHPAVLAGFLFAALVSVVVWR